MPNTQLKQTVSFDYDPKDFSRLTHLNGYSFGQPISMIIETNLTEAEHKSLTDILLPRIYQLTDNFMFEIRQERMK